MTAGMLANLALNALIAVLLVLTIGYCWLLNRRILILQDSKSELAQLLKHFDESTERASESILALQAASRKIGETIQGRIDKANYLIDDLSIMIDKGRRLTSQIEAGAAVSRARSRALADQELPEEAVMAPAPPPRPVEKQVTRERIPPSLDAVLERVTGRSAKVEAPAAQEKPSLRPRSKREEELLALIRGGMKG